MRLWYAELLCVAGLCRIAHALPVEAPSLAECKWAKGPVCNIIAETLWLPRPVPDKGNLGCWPLAEMAKIAIQGQVGQSAIAVRAHDTTYPPDPAAWRRKREGKKRQRDDRQPSLKESLAKQSKSVAPR